MDTSEKEDFDNVLKSHGYSIDDFVLNEKGLTEYTDLQVVNIRGTVTIKRISINKEKTYDTGNNTHWVVDFENDLKLGFWGQHNMVLYINFLIIFLHFSASTRI